MGHCRPPDRRSRHRRFGRIASLDAPRNDPSPRTSTPTPAGYFECRIPAEWLARAVVDVNDVNNVVMTRPTQAELPAPGVREVDDRWPRSADYLSRHHSTD